MYYSGFPPSSKSKALTEALQTIWELVKVTPFCGVTEKYFLWVCKDVHVKKKLKTCFNVCVSVPYQ